MSKRTITAGYMADAFSQAGLGFIVMLAAARSLELSEFGQLAFIMALASVQQPIASLGTQQLIYGRVALRTGKASQLTWQAFLITVSTSVLLYLFTILILIISFGPVLALVYCAAGLRVLGAVALPLVSDAQARHAQREYIPYRLTTTTCAAIATGLAFAYSAEAIIFALIWGGEAFAFALMMIISATKHKRLKKPNLQHSVIPFLVKSLPIAIQSIMVAIYYRFDQLYIQFRFGAEAMAQYAAAARLAELGNIVASIATMVLGPAFIARIFTKREFDTAIKSGAFIILLLAVAASAVSITIGEQVLTIIFGEDYGNGDKILSVYILSTAFVAIGGLCSRALSAKGHTQIQVFSGLAGMVTVIVLSILFCEIIGPVGAAWATVIAYAASSIVLAFKLFHVKSRALI